MAVAMLFRFSIILYGVWVILLFLVQAQEQLGFISIDCGLPDVPSYTDETSGITYVSDANFTEYGENREILPTYSSLSGEQQFQHLRSFPRGLRNCYSLKVSRQQGTRYFIRARFMYGNYDNKDEPPIFDLHLGVDLWATVKSEYGSKISKGIVHTPLSDRIDVCLVNTGSGVPFISVLELRPLYGDAYASQDGSALSLMNHYDFSSVTDQQARYKDDVYDRLWSPLREDVWRPSIDVSLNDENSITKNEFEIPSAVMGTAYTQSETADSMFLSVSKLNANSIHFLFLHFAELETIQTNNSREFNLYVNGDLWYEQETPRYLKVDTIYSTNGVRADTEGKIKIWLNNTDVATLPPIINAAEVYELKELSGKHTSWTEIEAISGVKSWYGLKRVEWQGDPCGPDAHRWDGLTCSYTNSSPTIVSLNLASTGLNGGIAPSIANLSKLESLDLSNNNLTGKVPEYLAHLPLLKLLNLTGNKHLNGPVPTALLSKKGLTLSVDPSLVSKNDSCLSCESNKSYVIPPVTSLSASSGLLFFMLLIVVVVYFVWRWCKRRKQAKTASDVRVETVKVEPKVEDLEFGTKTQQFTYSDIQKITSNFQRVVGEGGFGKVYHGYLDGNEVAVKMISSSSIQGHRQFVAELKLLLRVHHKNLTTLVGYCNDETNFGLIYEYMAMGNLRSHLSGIGGRKIVLSWEDRLRIAIDTAQGLEYLHNGCKPPIIHRDVKPTNILLNEMFQAKLGDFGLSKIFPSESGNHRPDTADTFGITASVVGTPGYLDPEYYESNWLNEKSDVYSFGVVLLELITARHVLTKPRENINIIHWVTSKLTTGDINTILDPKLQGNCDINGVWKTVEIAMACVSKNSRNRPTMSRVVTELKECSAMACRENDSSVEMVSKILTSEFSPLAR